MLRRVVADDARPRAPLWIRNALHSLWKTVSVRARRPTSILAEWRVSETKVPTHRDFSATFFVQVVRIPAKRAIGIFSRAVRELLRSGRPAA